VEFPQGSRDQDYIDRFGDKAIVVSIYTPILDYLESEYNKGEASYNPSGEEKTRYPTFDLNPIGRRLQGDLQAFLQQRNWSERQLDQYADVGKNYMRTVYKVYKTLSPYQGSGSPFSDQFAKFDLFTKSHLAGEGNRYLDEWTNVTETGATSGKTFRKAFTEFGIDVENLKPPGLVLKSKVWYQTQPILVKVGIPLAIVALIGALWYPMGDTDA
jgi:hypothetical protein